MSPPSGIASGWRDVRFTPAGGEPIEVREIHAVAIIEVARGRVVVVETADPAPLRGLDAGSRGTIGAAETDAFDDSPIRHHELGGVVPVVVATRGRHDEFHRALVVFAESRAIIPDWLARDFLNRPEDLRPGLDRIAVALRDQAHALDWRAHQLLARLDRPGPIRRAWAACRRAWSRAVIRCEMIRDRLAGRHRP